ncbi:MAG: uracil-DNA glycosylase family protein [Sphingorhabdus sp.]
MHRKMAESYLGWWRDAGLDVLSTEESRNWLKQGDGQAAPAREPESGEGTKLPAVKRPQPATPQAKLLEPEKWPKTLDELKQAVAAKAPLPGNHYGGAPVILLGDAGAKCLAIGDIPEKEEVDAGVFGAGPAGTLIQRMMQAVGLSQAEYAQAALATTRPATGALPEDDHALLSAFTGHLLGLIQPELVIIFGSAACQALLGAELMKARGNLHFINHNVQKVATITTFHPRTLLARPQMKAQAWKDLQVLIK